jgi:hypothetical protein
VRNVWVHGVRTGFVLWGAGGTPCHAFSGLGLAWSMDGFFLSRVVGIDTIDIILFCLWNERAGFSSLGVCPVDDSSM